jgi:hypothetical protein
MSREDLVAAYLDGQITRRIFVRRLVAAGVAIAAATSYARMMHPARAHAANSKDDFYDFYGEEAECDQDQNASQGQNQTQSGNQNQGATNSGNQQSNQSIQQQENCDTGDGGGGGGGGGGGQTQQNNQGNQNGNNQGIFGILNNIINQP